MILQVNRIAHPVTTLGPGRRLGLWVQGCHIGCRGCASRDTWDPAGGYSCETTELALKIADTILREDLTGITLTGGEPAEQPDALAAFVSAVRNIVGAARPATELDVLMFTGLTPKAVQRTANSLWAAIDAAVCGPYRADQPRAANLIASGNQRLVLVTPLGQTRHAGADNDPRPVIQFNITGSDLTLIGLPGPRDLDRIEAELLARGVAIGGTSWRTP